MAGKSDKLEMSVMASGSIRDIVTRINDINANGGNITRDDIVTLFREDGDFYLIYFK